MYGKSAGFIDFSSTYYFTQNYLAIGLGFELGYYRDTGFPSRTRHPVKEGSLTQDEIDHGSRIQLTIIPVKLPLSLVVTPLPFANWLQLAAWGGLDELYVQEIRLVDTATAGASASKTYLNTGWNSEVFFGGGIPIKLDALDSTATASTRFMGIKSYYLLPFFEVTRTTHVSTAKFDRTELGLMFLFEAI